MATAGGRIGSELDRFVEDVTRKLDRLTEEKDALKNRVAALVLSLDSLTLEVQNLPENQHKIEGRISDLQTRIEHACSSHKDLSLSFDNISKDCSASQDAIDEILEQHNALAAKAQDLAHSRTRAATTGLSPVAEGQKPDSKRPASEPSPLTESGDTNSSSQDSFRTTVEQENAMTLANDKQSLWSLNRSHLVQTANTAPSDTMLPPPRPDPAVTRNPALQRGRRAAVSSPPKPAFQREASVASTVTLRGDDSPAKKHVDLLPPAPVARRGFRAKSPARMKRKLADTASELPAKQKAAGGAKKRRVAAASASNEGTPKTGDGSVVTADFIDNRLELDTVKPMQKGYSGTPKDTVSTEQIDTAMENGIEEGENIVVLPRKTLPRYGASQHDFGPPSTLNGISEDDTVLTTEAEDTTDVQPSAIEHPQREARSRGISPETPGKTSLDDLRAIFQVRSGEKALPNAASSASPIVYSRTGKSTQSTREKNKKKAMSKKGF
ncbi:hypothetical protein D0864_14705 [Hortaea werneckii]|uniref:Uncharacterized protein n=1 Tax=Hortaea werneckii TaxID=91943 RepID=A0A3M7CC38_HORWE|nr:hypothetical protein D0864_14705 [Hortaea werneckii]